MYVIITKFNIMVFITTKWLHQRFQCWVVEMKKLSRWSILNIYITIKKVLEIRKNLPTNLEEAGDSCFQSSVLEELNTVVRQVVRMPEFTDHISEIVSEGSIHEHSDCLKFHDSTCSWQQYYLVLSFLMTGNLYSD